MTFSPDEPIDETLWRKSTRSGGGGQCVQVAIVPGAVVGIRDSKDVGGGELRFDPDAFAGFVDGIKAGEFDL